MPNDMRACAAITVACLSLGGGETLARTLDTTPVRKTGFGIDIYEASEVALAKLCMGSRFDGLPMADLAQREAALRQPSKGYGAGPKDTVYRLGPITKQVFAVDWADGTCSARVSDGDAEKLRALAERLILARPEGFKQTSNTSEQGGRVTRTVYCARRGDEQLIATITSPGEAKTRGTFALSSTVYRDKASRYCPPIL